jgi:hypothetical protein
LPAQVACGLGAVCGRVTPAGAPDARPQAREAAVRISHTGPFSEDVMLLADLLVAVALGQPCPHPLTASDPPPCAAANVPGCLPGYTPIRDRYGKVIYVCTAPQAAASAPAPAPAYAPAVAAAPPAYYPPPPVYAPPPTYAYPPPREQRGRLALVFMPGRTTDPAVGTNGGRELDRDVAGAAIELRGRQGGARLRFQGQWTELGRVAELGLKYDFFDRRSPIRPFVGLAAGASLLDPEKSWRASGSAFAGVDVYLDRNAFLTAEIQGRRFANRTTSDGGRGLDLSDRRQTTVLVGIGMYL